MICVPNETILFAAGIVAIVLALWWAWRESH
jgi:hypothetical protein